MGHFCEILPFSTGNNSSTKPCFQSNSTIFVWSMYRGKGFVLSLIGNDALLPSYCQLKTQFWPFWTQNGLPLGCHWVATGAPLGAQWVPSGHPVGAKWPSFTTKWVNRRGAIILHKITHRNNSIFDRIVERFTLSYYYSTAHTNSN